MKTSVLKTMTGTLIAGLAAAMVAGSVHAEDEGVVRLGQSSSHASAAVSEEGRVVVRGQSSQSQDTSTVSPRMLQLISSESSYACEAGCDGMTCDGCDTYAGGGYGDADGSYGYGDGGYGDSEGGYGSCPDCNGDGCHRCRRQARRAKRDFFGLGGGLFNRFGGGGDCGYGDSGSDCPVCNAYGCMNNCRAAGFLSGQCAQHRARTRANNQVLNSYLRCKLGYFLPDGCGGAGCPLFGCYSIVYPNNPAHFDGRDGQIYAAQGVGGPVSVPLAPNVRHAYNYGWGVPSSRLTPVSNPAY